MAIAVAVLAVFALAAAASTLLAAATRCREHSGSQEQKSLAAKAVVAKASNGSGNNSSDDSRSSRSNMGLVLSSNLCVADTGLRLPAPPIYGDARSYAGWNFAFGWHVQSHKQQHAACISIMRGLLQSCRQPLQRFFRTGG